MPNWNYIIKKGEYRGQCRYCGRSNMTLVDWEYGGSHHYICIYCLKQFIKALSVLDDKINSDDEFEDIIELIIDLSDRLKEMNKNE